MNKRGLILVISGFSGVGKGTVVRRLMEAHENYALSVSVTTRPPREGEVHGKDYFFISEEEFSSMEAEGRLMEWAGYVGRHYGTPRDYVFKKLEEGKDMILEIEVQGALQIKEKYPEAILVFVAPPSAATLKERLLKRGTESAEQVEKRLFRAVEESEAMESYDYLLVNDDLETCMEELHRLMQCEHRKMRVSRELIREIKTDLKRFVEGES
ncbi:MAG: guanylate kinase [Lachnospiraceae bacterium]|nr:guanylate kinase [Lachnospiraceae bacterium]